MPSSRRKTIEAFARAHSAVSPEDYLSDLDDYPGELIMPFRVTENFSLDTLTSFTYPALARPEDFRVEELTDTHLTLPFSATAVCEYNCRLKDIVEDLATSDPNYEGPEDNPAYDGIGHMCEGDINDSYLLFRREGATPSEIGVRTAYGDSSWGEDYIYFFADGAEASTWYDSDEYDEEMFLTTPNGTSVAVAIVNHED